MYSFCKVKCALTCASEAGTEMPGWESCACCTSTPASWVHGRNLVQASLAFPCYGTSDEILDHSALDLTNRKWDCWLLCKLEGTENLANHSNSNQIDSQRSGQQIEICLDSSILSSQTKKPCLCFCCSGVLVDINEAQANPWQWHLGFMASYSQQAELYRFPQRMRMCQINTNINVQA